MRIYVCLLYSAVWHWYHRRVWSLVKPLAGNEETQVLVPALPLTYLCTNHRASLDVLSSPKWRCCIMWSGRLLLVLKFNGGVIYHGVSWPTPLFSPCATDIIQKPPQHEYRCGLSVWQRLFSRGNYWAWQPSNPGLWFWDVTVTSVMATVSNSSSTYMAEYAVPAVRAPGLFFF
jgi:hypothetical protein